MIVEETKRAIQLNNFIEIIQQYNHHRTSIPTIIITVERYKIKVKGKSLIMRAWIINNRKNQLHYQGRTINLRKIHSELQLLIRIIFKRI